MTSPTPSQHSLSEQVVAPPAPSIVSEQRKESALENTLDQRDQDQPLTESVAPLPVRDELHEHRDSELSREPRDEGEPKQPQAQPESQPTLSKYATHLYTVSYLIFFAIFGTLARLGLQAITFYPGAPVDTGVLWANVGGSLIMGFLLEDKVIFAEEWGTPQPKPRTEDERNEREKKHKAVKKTIPLYIGLTTGFCGSFTSFSSFMRDVFLALTNDLPNPSVSTIVPRNGGYSFMALIAVMLVTVSLSLSALIFGGHFALAVQKFTPTLPFSFTRRVLDPLVIFLAWGCWLGAVFLAIWPPDRHEEMEHWRGRAAFAIVFAPLGCLLRFYTSLLLNARIPSFPLGTFTINIFGTIIEAMAFDLQRVDGIGSSSSLTSPTSSILTSCQALQGIMDGFCGAATTISTWVAELNGLAKRRHAYFYGTASVAVALGFLVVIVGSLGWTRGFGTPVCG